MTKIVWTKDLNSKTYEDALSIRYEVFVNEQNVPKDMEIDEFEDKSHHVVLYEEEQPVGTARIYHLGDGVYKIQRVAVLKEHRKKGIGAKLMNECELQINKQHGTKITLGAQLQALSFYEGLGYTAEGPEFMDAGIPHREMMKKLV